MRIHNIALSKQQITDTTGIAVDVSCHRLRLSHDNAGYVEIYILIKFVTRIEDAKPYIHHNHFEAINVKTVPGAIGICCVTHTHTREKAAQFFICLVLDETAWGCSFPVNFNFDFENNYFEAIFNNRKL